MFDLRITTFKGQYRIEQERPTHSMSPPLSTWEPFPARYTSLKEAQKAMERQQEPEVWSVVK